MKLAPTSRGTPSNFFIRSVCFAAQPHQQEEKHAKVICLKHDSVTVGGRLKSARTLGNVEDVVQSQLVTHCIKVDGLMPSTIPFFDLYRDVRKN